jgi:hypothetical protein
VLALDRRGAAVMDTVVAAFLFLERPRRVKETETGRRAEAVALSAGGTTGWSVG